jgi:hypothetical protein
MMPCCFAGTGYDTEMTMVMKERGTIIEWVIQFGYKGMTKQSLQNYKVFPGTIER